MMHSHFQQKGTIVSKEFEDDSYISAALVPPFSQRDGENNFYEFNFQVNSTFTNQEHEKVSYFGFAKKQESYEVHHLFTHTDTVFLHTAESFVMMDGRYD